jgi:hypothetical protein
VPTLALLQKSQPTACKLFHCELQHSASTNTRDMMFTLTNKAARRYVVAYVCSLSMIVCSSVALTTRYCDCTCMTDLSRYCIIESTRLLAASTSGMHNQHLKLSFRLILKWVAVNAQSLICSFNMLSIMHSLCMSRSVCCCCCSQPVSSLVSHWVDATQSFIDGNNALYCTTCHALLTQ